MTWDIVPKLLPSVAGHYLLCHIELPAASAELPGTPVAPPLGATATTAASGGNREELLGQRPAGCKRQRSRRWEPQPGRWHCEAMTERARTLTKRQGLSDRAALTKKSLIAARRLCRDGLALSGAHAPDSPFCRLRDIFPRPGEVFPQRESLLRKLRLHKTHNAL